MDGKLPLATWKQQAKPLRCLQEVQNSGNSCFYELDSR